MTMKALRAVLWSLVAAMVIGIGTWVAIREPQPAKTVDTAALKPVAGIGGAFDLVDQTGKPFTQADLVGHPNLVFFGYTYCPDVCPTTLLEAEGWMKALEADADRLHVIFVTVDPERDTPKKLQDYLSSFDPRFIGLSGPRDKIDAMLKAYRVFARKVEGKGGEYTMDHTAAVYMIDPQGRFVGIINFQEDTAKAMTKIRRLMTMR